MGGHFFDVTIKTMETATYFKDFIHVDYTERHKPDRRSYTKPPQAIKIADLEDKKIYHLRSLTDAERFFGISPRSIGLRFKGKINNTAIFGRYLPAPESEEFDVSHIVITRLPRRDPNKRSGNIAVQVKLKNIKTEEIFEFESIKLAAKFIGTSASNVSDVINGWIKNPIIKGKFIIALKNMEFEKLPKNLSVFRAKLSVRRKVNKIVAEKDGIQKEFKCIARFARFLELDKDMVYYHIRNGVKDVKVLNGWKVISPTPDFFATTVSPFVKFSSKKERFKLNQAKAVSDNTKGVLREI